MWCPRCEGLMVKNRFLDYWEENGKRYCNGFRCVICGEVIDKKILINREAGKALEPMMGH